MASTIICPHCHQPFTIPGWQIGKRRFCSNVCRNSAGASEETRQKMRAVTRPHGKNHPSWRGGTRQHGGYVRVYAPDHPNRDPKDYVLEHRLVMERTLGRLLTKSEVVHHINGVTDDNRPENLQLFPSQSDHRKHHGPSCVNPLNSSTQRQCSKCRVVKPLTEDFFARSKKNHYGFDYRCRDCEKARWRDQIMHGIL